MRKTLYVACVLAMSLALAGCGASTSPTTSTPAAESGTKSEMQTTSQEQAGKPGGSGNQPVSAAAEGSPEQVLEQVQQDFAATQQSLLEKQAELFTQVGGTYDGYLANVDAVQAWYDLSVSETEALGARTLENARQYYRAVSSTVDHGDDDALDDALDDFYDLIYDDAFEGYYDSIYDEGFEGMYDQYYDGIITDAYNTVPYADWYDAKSDSYDAWYDAKSDVYDAWFDAKSDVYEEWFDIKSGFYGNKFDVDKILRLD